MQNLKYKFRLYPSPDQVTDLNQVIGNARYIWNQFLDQEIQEYKLNQKFKFYYKNCVDLTKLKETLEWLNKSPSTSLQQTLRNLNTALTHSFEKNGKAKKGFPKFKKKQNFDGSFTLAMVNSARNCDFINHKFKIPNIGWIDTKFHRELPSDFKTCQIKKESNIWFLVLTCKKAKLPPRTTTNSVGIDINSNEYVLSNGTRYQIPKFLRESQAKIKKLQRDLSKKEKGSNNRLKAQLKLNKVNYTVRNQRLDYFHKLSKQLVNDYDIISLEDLNVRSIQEWNGHITKDNGFAMFRRLIEYKADLYGVKTVIVDRYFPSSQLCSHCSGINKISLKTRTYKCRTCDLEIDRDLNAAINIDRAGTARFNACGNAQLLANQIMIGQLIGIDEPGIPVL